MMASFKNRDVMKFTAGAVASRVFIASLFMVVIAASSLFPEKLLFSGGKEEAGVVVVVCLLFCYAPFLVKKTAPSNVLFFLALLFFLLLSIFLMAKNSYGYYKIFSGGVVPLFFALYGSKIKNLTEEDVVQAFLFFSTVALLAALFHKAGQGFFVRGERFGFFGAITMSWIMSMACLVSLYFYILRSASRYAWLAFLFFCAVAWTQSRGGGGALILSAIFLLFYMRGEFSKGRLVFGLLIGCAGLAALVWMLPSLMEGRVVKSTMQVLSDGGALEEYFGLRYIFYSISIDAIKNNPMLGVGVGGWAELNDVSHHVYPHNILLEVASEIGVFYFLVFLVVIFILFFGVGPLGKVVLIYGGISLSFSGDFSYLRYFLMIPMVLFFLQPKRC